MVDMRCDERASFVRRLHSVRELSLAEGLTLQGDR